MQREKEISIIRELFKHVEQKTTQMGDSETIYPVEMYFDSDRFNREQKSIFSGYPLLICRSSEIPETGDYLTNDATPVPILLVRSKEGKVNAFINVCRHRGTRLLNEQGCGIKAIQCPYHNWTYDLDGKLKGIPDKFGFSEPGESKNLVPLPTQEYLGFIWVIPDQNQSIDMEDFLGPVAGELAKYQLESHYLYQKKSEMRKLNWKLIFDLFLEVYHIKTAHRNTIAPIFHSNIYLYEKLKLHLRTINPKYRVDQLRDKDPKFWDLRKVANVEYVIFPNIMVLIEPNHIDVLVIYPQTAETSRVDFYALVEKPATTSLHERVYKRSVELLNAAVNEDLEIGEGIQSGLRSGANRHLTFGKFEEAIEIYHNTIEKSL